MKEVKLYVYLLGRLGSVHAENLAFKIPGCQLKAACSLEQKELDWAKDGILRWISSPLTTRRWSMRRHRGGCYRILLARALLDDRVRARRGQACVHRQTARLLARGVQARRGSGRAPSGQGILPRLYAPLRSLVCGCQGQGGRRPDWASPIWSRRPAWTPRRWSRAAFKFSKTSGGIFIDAASHDIDLMRWFLCGEVTEVLRCRHDLQAP